MICLLPISGSYGTGYHLYLSGFHISSFIPTGLAINYDLFATDIWSLWDREPFISSLFSHLIFRPNGTGYHLYLSGFHISSFIPTGPGKCMYFWFSCPVRDIILVANRKPNQISPCRQVRDIFLPKNFSRLFTAALFSQSPHKRHPCNCRLQV
jgi:hypothetical protein